MQLLNFVFLLKYSNIKLDIKCCINYKNWNKNPVLIIGFSLCSGNGLSLKRENYKTLTKLKIILDSDYY